MKHSEKSNSLSHRRYTSQKEYIGFLKLIKGMWSDLLDSRYLGYRLAKRDLSAQFKQSLLGYLWLFIMPLSQTLVWVFLNSTGVVNDQHTEIPYVAYVFAGTMMWQVFTDSILGTLGAVNGGVALLSKLNFPREALLINSFYKIGVNAIIRFCLIIPVFLFFGVYPDWTIIFSPFILISFILVGTSIGLLLVPIGQIYHDIGRLIPMVLQFIMYISPVLFAIPTKGFMKTVYEFNFISPLLVTFRDSLSGGDFNWIFSLIVVNFISFILLLIGWIIYRATMPILIERMSN